MALNPQQFNGISDARAASVSTTAFFASGKANQLQPYEGAASNMATRNLIDPDTAHISLGGGEGPEYFHRYRNQSKNWPTPGKTSYRR